MTKKALTSKKTPKSCRTNPLPNVEGDTHEHRHHILTAAVTFLHVGIALATISIVTGGKRWPWLVALALGLAGVVGTAYAYLPIAH